jgi:hypothetical protein
LGRDQGAGAVESLHHSMPLVLEVPSHQGVQFALIFDYQDCRHRS